MHYILCSKCNRDSAHSGFEFVTPTAPQITLTKWHLDAASKMMLLSCHKTKDSALCYHTNRVYICMKVLFIEDLVYLIWIFPSLPFMWTVEIPLLTHFSGPEVMTSQPEVTTFWGRLSSFGDENPFFLTNGEIKWFSGSWGHHCGLSYICGVFGSLYFPYFTFMN